MLRYYPWHDQDWSKLIAPKQGWPQALLVSGSPFTGGESFAESLALFLLCESPTELGFCGQCQPCKLGLESPDCHHITSTGASNAIKVDEIRAVIDFATQTSSGFCGKVVLLQNAHRMNVAAQNALLKVLEEPPTSVRFVLESSMPAMLLPTIRSRTQDFVLSSPSMATVADWLKTKLPANGVDESGLFANLFLEHPLLADAWLADGYREQRLQIIESLTSLKKIAGGVKELELAAKLPAERLLYCWRSLLADCVKLGLAVSFAKLKNIDCINTLQGWSQSIHMGKLFDFAQLLQDVEQKFLAKPSLNQQLAVDVLLAKWQTL